MSAIHSTEIGDLPVDWRVQRFDSLFAVQQGKQVSKKWASCSTNGNLNFNVELLDLDKKIGDYIIVHELLHFSMPNHGKLWKSLLTAYVGDYERLERRLRELS